MEAETRVERRLALLGGFRLTAADTAYEVSTAGQRLLAYLAVRWGRQPVRRSCVLDELWTDTPPPQASSSLRSVLWRLPRPGGHRLVDVTSASELVLAPDVSADVWQVTRAAALADAGGLASATAPAVAVADLRNDLLPGWDDEWVLLERESYRQARMHYLELLAEKLREAGRYAASLQAALTAVECDPLRESAHRCVIETHLAEGNASEALRHYRVYHGLIASELGLQPSPAMWRQVAPLHPAGAGPARRRGLNRR
jgi:DNA-binding SARP family transcriptional activator